MSKLYANALLTTLNMRQYILEIEESNATSNIFNLTTTRSSQGICGPQISSRVTPAFVLHIEESRSMNTHLDGAPSESKLGEPVVEDV